MKRVFSLIALILVSVFFSACLSPYDRSLPMTTEEEEGFNSTFNEIKPEEADLLKSYMERMRKSRRGGGPGMLPGTTVKKAIDDQRVWAQAEALRVKEEKAKALKKAMEEEEKQIATQKKQKEMLEILDVEVIKKKSVEAKYANRFSMSLKFRNKGKKDIMSVMGKLQFFDEEKKLLKEIKIPYRDRIKAGKSETSGGDFPFNPGNEQDVKLAETPLEKLTTKWVPMVYQFRDGTRIGVGI